MGNEIPSTTRGLGTAFVKTVLVDVLTLRYEMKFGECLFLVSYDSLGERRTKNDEHARFAVYEGTWQLRSMHALCPRSPPTVHCGGQLPPRSRALGPGPRMQSKIDQAPGA